MSFGKTKTIPTKDGRSHVNSLHDGSRSAFEFHLVGKPSKLKVGNYV